MPHRLQLLKLDLTNHTGTTPTVYTQTVHTETHYYKGGRGLQAGRAVGDAAAGRDFRRGEGCSKLNHRGETRDGAT